MGYFGTWLYQDGAWSAAEEPSSDSDVWLHLDVYDSDITTIQYSPTGDGTGVAYIGVSPRVYFDEESASEPTDPALEATAIASWVATQIGGEAATLETVIRPFLADDEEPGDFDESVELDDADVFVEQKTLQFIEAIGLPEPPGYWD